jgi:hypothetical protein
MKYSSFPVVALLGHDNCIHWLQEARTMRLWRYTGSLQRCAGVLQIRHSRRSLPRRRKRCHENDNESFHDYQWGSRRTEL